LAYGIPKITSKELKQQILDCISAVLERDANLSGNNLAFYGADIDFKMDLTLVSRGEQRVGVFATATVGDSSPPQKPEGSVKPTVPEAPQKATVKVSGRRQTGRKHVAHKNPSSTDKSLESKPGAAQADKRTVVTLSPGTGEIS